MSISADLRIFFLMALAYEVRQSKKSERGDFANLFGEVGETRCHQMLSFFCQCTFGDIDISLIFVHFNSVIHVLGVRCTWLAFLTILGLELSKPTKLSGIGFSMPHVAGRQLKHRFC